MSKLRLSMACWNYDRTRALLEERIPIDGIDLTYINIPVEETFFRMIRHREFDVCRNVPLLLHAFLVSGPEALCRHSGLPFAISSGTPASSSIATAGFASRRI